MCDFVQLAQSIDLQYNTLQGLWIVEEGSDKNYSFKCFPKIVLTVYCKVRNINVEEILATLTSGSDSLILRSVNICSF